MSRDLSLHSDTRHDYQRQPQTITAPGYAENLRRESCWSKTWKRGKRLRWLQRRTNYRAFSPSHTDRQTGRGRAKERERERETRRHAWNCYKKKLRPHTTCCKRPPESHACQSTGRLSYQQRNQRARNRPLFSSLAVLDPSVGHTMDVRSPFIPVLSHSD